ncbi:MAG: RNA-binding S4 domain-containing protein [Bacteroidetes bacterium]|nr:RNA-binding S4 domain-containing protein [Bacteroidota bacterium]
MRIDKFLWCVRLFKTRSLATEQVKLGKVLMNGEMLKPSKEIKIGERLEVKRGPVLFSFQVLDFPKARLGAKMVEHFVKEVTSEEEKKKWLLLQDQLKLTRERGTGRPTKKDRREMDAFLDLMDPEDMD